MVSDVVVVNEGSFVQVSRVTVIGDKCANQPLNLKGFIGGKPCNSSMKSRIY